jgi:hypothetical protein
MRVKRKSKVRRKPGIWRSHGKIQTPRSKIQRRSKHPSSKGRSGWRQVGSLVTGCLALRGCAEALLMFGSWFFWGSWTLVFGVSSRFMERCEVVRSPSKMADLEIVFRLSEFQVEHL